MTKAAKEGSSGVPPSGAWRSVAGLAAWVGCSSLGACGGDPPQLPSVEEGDARTDVAGEADSGADEGESGGELPDGGGDSDGGEDDALDDVDLPPTCADAAASHSGLGCEFWAVDLPNAPAGASMAPDDLPFVVALANPRTGSYAKIQVCIGGLDEPIELVELVPGEAITLALPAMGIPHHATGVGEVAYRIDSDSPIAVFQFNPLGGPASSTDASTLLPVHRLREAYTAVTGNGLWSADSFAFAGAFVSVVATENDTIVDVLPSWHNLAPGEIEGVRLDRGEVFTTISRSDNPFPQFPSEQAELSGTGIVANRPVAVFSGNVSTQEPVGTCCADHLEEQLPPHADWGTAYLAVPPPGASGESEDAAAYRIVASADQTPLAYWPQAPEGAPTVVDAGQVVRFETNETFWVSSPDPGKPISLTQFLLSNRAMDGGARPGDPAMLALPDRTRFSTSHVAYAPEGFAENFVSVVRVADSPVAVDEVHLVGTDWRHAATYAGVDYEYVSLRVDAGLHEVRCDAACSVVAVGYGDAVSYGYVAAAGAPSVVQG